jgi:PEP-CTERM motif
MKLRSLFVVVAGAFLLTAAFVPRADALVVSYFNFEDAGPNGNIIDLTPDKTPGAGGNNTGGGLEPSTTNLTLVTTANAGVVAGVPSNVTTNPPDQDANLHAVNFNNTKNTTTTISFTVNTEFFAGYSLSYATNNNGNGYQTVNLSFTGGPVGGITQTNPQSPGTTVTFNLTSFTSLNGDGMTPHFVTFTLTFTNGNSNGNDLMTVIDNIRLDATTFVPEPTTIAGGLLGVLGLCWHQRRRLIRSVRFRRT